MTLLLDGSPAVGTLTIAKEMARLTGFTVFHNHLTVNLVAAMFPEAPPRIINGCGISGMRCSLKPHERISRG